MNCPMWDLLKLIWSALVGRFRSISAFELENLALRHQLNVLRRQFPKRPSFGNFDRLIFVCLFGSHRASEMHLRS
jgi:hypothetical protein